MESNYLVHLGDVAPDWYGETASYQNLLRKFMVSEDKPVALDTETTGLMPFHGDRPFAVIFNFGDASFYLPLNEKIPHDLKAILEDPKRTWVMHNAKFDMHHLWTGFEVNIKGTVWDTMVGARLEYNEHMSYSLDACAARLGLTKDNAVEVYIEENKLWEWQEVPGKKVRRKNKFYQKVPLEIMLPYACNDARITMKLYENQKERFDEIDALLPNSPKVADLMTLENKVTQTVCDIETFGVHADIKFCEEAVAHYVEVAIQAEEKFKAQTGLDYKASPKLFEKVFEEQKDNWVYTEKGNPSFDSDTLKSFKHPVADNILTLRDAKSRADFFSGFLFYADSSDFVHPHFNQAGTTGGRFSSSEPNFQNLTNDEDNAAEKYQVRRAIVPINPEYCIVSLDYDQQEYRLLLDYAGEHDLIAKVMAGEDVHEATAALMGVSRKYAKTLNFMLLYGGGAEKLAESLDVSLEEAKRLKALYFAKLPNVKKIINQIISTAELRGYVHNWRGRRFWCQREHAYKMPNRVIQGGGADIMKEALVKIDALLKTSQSVIFLTVHDEICLYMHREDLDLTPKIKEIMENVYTPKNGMKLTVSVNHSWENLADLKEGLPEQHVWDKGTGIVKRASGRRELPVYGQDKSYRLGEGVRAGDGGVEKPDDPKPYLSEVDKLLKVFGVARRDLPKKVCHFQVTGLSLFGVCLDESRVKLANADYSIISHYAKEQGFILKDGVYKE